MTEPKDEWRTCLALLERVASLFRDLNRNADVDLGDRWPEFQAVKDSVDDYLYPDDLPLPYERLEAIDVEGQAGEVADERG